MKDFSNNELYKLIENDENLMGDGNLRKEILTYTEMYLNEFEENYMLTSFDLDKKYGTYDFESWEKFLTLPAVSKYRNTYMARVSIARAEQDIMSGHKSKDAIAVRDKMKSQLGSDDNSRIVIIRMPPKKSHLLE